MGELDEKLNAILANPQAMGQIMTLARSLGGEGEQDADCHNSAASEPECALQQVEAMPSFGDIDPRFLQLGMKLIKEYRREDDEKTALLMALRPFVRESRYEKLDRAIQAARLSRVIRVLFDSMGKGEDGV